MKNLRVLCLVVILSSAMALALPIQAFAFQQRAGDNVVVSTPVSDDLFLFGANIEVSAPVDGDVFAFGQNITISADVSGTVVTAGQTVRVTGNVTNSVRAAGQDIQISGNVGRDLMAAGATIRLAQGGSVGRDVAAAGQTLELDGDVGRNVQAGVGSLTIASRVGGDVTAEVSELTVMDTGLIEGNLDYTSANQASIQGEVQGSTTRHEPQVRTQPERNPAVGVFFGVLGWIRGLIGVLLLGTAVMLLSRNRLTVVSDTLAARPWPSLGFGLLVLFAVWPVAGMVFGLGLLIGGWWISFVLLAVVWLLALLGLIVGGLALGKLILGWMHADLHPILAMGLGILVIWVVGAVPFVGWLLGFAAVAFGTGAALLVAFRRPPTPGSPAEQYAAPGPAQAPYAPAYPPPYAPAPVPPAPNQPPYAPPAPPPVPPEQQAPPAELPPET